MKPDTLLFFSVASLQVSFDGACDPSTRSSHSFSASCCAFPIWPDGQLVAKCQSAGRVLSKSEIVDKFNLKRAAVDATSSPDTLAGQAIGYEYLFVCAPGTDLIGSGKHGKATSQADNILSFLRPAVSYFGVRKYFSLDKFAAATTSQPLSANVILSSSLPTAQQTSSFIVPMSSSPAHAPISPPTVSNGVQNSHVVNKAVSSTLVWFTSDPSTATGVDTKTDSTDSTPSEVASPSLLKNEKTESDNKAGKSILLTLNISAAAKRSKNREETKSNLDKLMFDLLREMARERLRSPAKTEKLIREVEDRVGFVPDTADIDSD